MGILERMKDRAVKTKQELDQERDKDKKERERLERERVNESAPMYQRLDAWCETCKRDYFTIMRKHGNELLAWYASLCPKMHPLRREIALRDRYYHLSHKVRAEADLWADALLTPDHPRFRLVYPDKWRELEAQREARESLNVQKQGGGTAPPGEG